MLSNVYQFLFSVNLLATFAIFLTVSNRKVKKNASESEKDDGNYASDEGF